MPETKEWTNREIFDHVRERITRETDGDLRSLLGVADCLAFEFPLLPDGARKLVSSYYRRYVGRIEFAQGREIETIFFYP